MEPLSEHMKESDPDKISNLPPEILCKILSFLDAREAVRTCILSPKWRHIWASIPSICLHQTVFDEENVEAFERFGDSLLHHLKTMHLDTFRLTSCHWYSPRLPCASRWIAHAVKLNPRVIYIDLNVKQDMYFPDCIFICGTLEELTCMICHTPKHVDLPRLKILKIGNSTFSDDFMLKLNSGCPVLEIFTLENCGGLSLISSSILKELTIDSFWEISKRIDISIPTVASLYLGGTVPGLVHLLNLPSLVCATVRYVRDEGGIGRVKFLGELAKVKHLSLYGQIVEDLSEMNKFPIFINLKSLTLGECVCRKNIIPILTSFLEHMPNLERLTLENISCNEKGKMLFQFEHPKHFQMRDYKSGAGQFIKDLVISAGTPQTLTPRYLGNEV